MKNEHFLSCDWGTSTFRLRWVNIATKTVLASVENNIGIKNVFEKWKTQNTDNESLRIDFYLQFLQSSINELEKITQQNLSDLPILVSGMASSSIGIKSLAYNSLPFDLNKQNFVWEKINSAKFSNPIILLSGLSAKQDVMRGEETQVLGLSDEILENAGIFIFPGTHSKHIFIENQQVTDFKTYLTGELFSVLSQYSILNNVKSGDTFQEKRFKKGVKISLSQNFLHSLFSIRGAQLLNGMNPEEAYYFLSGLLIGTELKDLQNLKNTKIVFCCGENLLKYYQTAAEVLLRQMEYDFLKSEIVENLVVLGHLKALDKIRFNL